MPVREDPEQDELQRLALADDRPLDLGEDALAPARSARRSVIDTSSSRSSRPMVRSRPSGRDRERSGSLGRLAVGRGQLQGSSPRSSCTTGRPRSRSSPRGSSLAAATRAGPAAGGVQVELPRGGHRELALEPEQARRSGALRADPARVPPRRATARGRGEPAQLGREDEEPERAEDEDEDVELELLPPGREHARDDERDRRQDREARRQRSAAQISVDGASSWARSPTRASIASSFIFCVDLVRAEPGALEQPRQAARGVAAPLELPRMRPRYSSGASDSRLGKPRAASVRSIFA